MRRLVVFVTLLVLATPFAAAASVRAPGDGTLSVKNLDGRITVVAKGAVIGRCDQCTLTLDDWKNDEITPVVLGAKGVDLDDDGAKERFTGKDLRWKVIGGSFRMIVRNAKGAHLSIVGKGPFVSIAGTDGTFSLNDKPAYAVLPDRVTFALSATAVIP